MSIHPRPAEAGPRALRRRPSSAAAHNRSGHAWSPTGGARSLPIGLRLPGRLTFDQWCEVGRRVGIRANASTWWLGDWLLYGERSYGSRYAHAAKVTGLDQQTLRNHATVARRFRSSRRREELSFEHHAEVCLLADGEQETWLDRAVAGGWSRNELRRRLRAARGPSDDDGDTAVRFTIAPERLERWRRAAQRSDGDLSTWAAASLDEAADRLLDEPSE
jgi:hypothetical protein